MRACTLNNETPKYIYHKKTECFPQTPATQPSIYKNEPTMVFFLFCIGLVELVELGEFK